FPRHQGAALQDAEALLLLGCAAKVRLRQDSEAAGARRAGSAGLARHSDRGGWMMRWIEQPGPPPTERIQWVEGRGRAFSFTLEGGLPLLEAVRRGFAREGFAGGTLNIKGGALGPFAYVMPALSKTSEYAGFYSDTFRPDGVTRLKLATMTFGQRDSAPFFH